MYTDLRARQVESVKKLFENDDEEKEEEDLVENEEEISKAKIGLEAIARRGRLPLDCEKIVLRGTFPDGLKNGPTADINIFGISDEISVREMHTITLKVETTCLFIRDSGQESALA